MGDFAHGVVAEQTRVINALFDKIVTDINNGDAVNQFVGEIKYLYPNFKVQKFLREKRDLRNSQT